MEESSVRSVAKTVSWRLTGSGATFAISYMISGDINIAGSIAIIQVLANTVLYFIHERIWNRINWGRGKTQC